MWNSLPSYIVEASSVEAFERIFGRDQNIIYNYKATLSFGHSDQDGNDISLDSSDNDLEIQI